MVAELPQVSAESPLIPATIPRTHKFTKENAREMALRANAKRWEKWRAERAAEENPPTVALPQGGIPDEVYRMERLARTRRQIEMLDKELENCDVPKDVKAIADAIARLTDIEFALAGRSKPGLTRPSRQSNKSAPVMSEPTE